jgi:hypothetical protein
VEAGFAPFQVQSLASGAEREVAGLDRGDRVPIAVGAGERLHDGGETMARAVIA